MSITKPIYIDFLAGKLGYRAKHGGGSKQLLAKAVGSKGKNRPSVLDATAGFGADAFILATLGCKVLMLERSPIVAELLQDALQRLKQSLQYQDLQFELIITDAIDYLAKQQNFVFDVIYLDPMYPERVKSALGKKPLRVLREIVGDDLDADLLLEAALKRALKRVVVKRPKLAPFLLNKKPDLIFSHGKSSRFDVYFC